MWSWKHMCMFSVSMLACSSCRFVHVCARSASQIKFFRRILLAWLRWKMKSVTRLFHLRPRGNKNLMHCCRKLSNSLSAQNLFSVNNLCIPLLYQLQEKAVDVWIIIVYSCITLCVVLHNCGWSGRCGVSRGLCGEQICLPILIRSMSWDKRSHWGRRDNLNSCHIAAEFLMEIKWRHFPKPEYFVFFFFIPPTHVLSSPSFISIALI